MRRTWARAFSAFGASVTLIGSSCSVEELDLENHPCPCVTGYVCDEARNTCVRPSALVTDAGLGPCSGPGCACANPSDCKDPAYPQCIGGTCVECANDPDTCTAGRYCLPSHECAPGCKSNDECAMLSPTAPFCALARHQCVNCLSDSDCNGKRCSPAGACVEACTNGVCPQGKECCGGLCIDASSDPLNCSQCGAACTGSKTQCCAGRCVDPLTTVDNCGQCGTVCSTTNGTPSCVSGACRWNCASGFSHCEKGNTGCETNTSSDVNHCGSCTRGCSGVEHATGVACVASRCTYTSCSSGYHDCDEIKANGCESQSSPCPAPTCGRNGQVCCAGNTCLPGAKCESDGECH